MAEKQRDLDEALLRQSKRAEDADAEAFREQYNYSQSSPSMETRKVMNDLWALIAQQNRGLPTAREAGSHEVNYPAERMRILRKAGHVFKNDSTSQGGKFIMPTPAGIAQIAYTQPSHADEPSAEDEQLHRVLRNARWAKIREACKTRLFEMSKDPEFMMEMPPLTAAESRDAATASALRCMKQFLKESKEMELPTNLMTDASHGASDVLPARPPVRKPRR